MLPKPRHIELQGGTVTLPTHSNIVGPADLLFEMQTLQGALAASGLRWDILAAGDYSYEWPIELRISPEETHPQGYTLTIAAAGVRISGADTAGVFYGVCTLRQLLIEHGPALPALVIRDWPDFAARGVMLDVSRDKVPSMATLYALIDRLASWKINQLQLYMEHTFAYQGHEQVWELASPFTAQEILELDAYCRQRHIDLVPNQNSLGHMERWLKHAPYQHLAETPDGFTTPWGEFRAEPSTLNPLDAGSLELITGLYDQLLPHFSSKLFNVGCDEPWELGQGKSKAAVEEHGGRVYLEWLLKLHEAVTVRGRQMQFWGDIILHHPDLVPELPSDAIVMEWGYEADHDFAGHGGLFAGSGLPFYVCPGTSSWNTLAGRTDNALGNLATAAREGLHHGAIGYLNTDWGDNGHWQPLPVSYLGFAYGAAVSWCYGTNQDAADLPAQLDAFAFDDEAGVMGRLAYELGNVYQMLPLVPNSSLLFWLLQFSDERLQETMTRYQLPNAEDTLRQAMARIDEIMAPLIDTRMQRADASLIKTEFSYVAAMLKHGARRGLLALGIEEAAALAAERARLIPLQREVWLARNRRGGLEDSIVHWH